MLPALPDAWPSGTVKELRAKGCFEILSMEWKAAKLVRIVIRPTLGGNLRLRLPCEMRSLGGGILRPATGENPNSFYAVDPIAPPVISGKATIQLPQLKPTVVYDFMTQARRTYSFVSW